MKQKQYIEWNERLAGLGASCIWNATLIDEFEELLYIYHSRLVDELDALDRWERL
jgi:hypothetical protein